MDIIQRQLRLYQLVAGVLITDNSEYNKQAMEFCEKPTWNNLTPDEKSHVWQHGLSRFYQDQDDPFRKLWDSVVPGIEEEFAKESNQTIDVLDRIALQHLQGGESHE